MPNNTDYKEPYLLNYKDNVRENYGTVRKLIVKMYKKLNNINDIFEFGQHYPVLLVKALAIRSTHRHNNRKIYTLFYYFPTTYCSRMMTATCRMRIIINKLTLSVVFVCGLDCV